VQSIGGTPVEPIICSSDIQCPVDRYVGDYYCNNGDVYRNYQDYWCGNVTRRCTSSITPRLIDDCSSGEQCVEGQSSCQSVFSCSDSDGGLNYTLRGHTTGVNATGPFDNWDYCSTSNGLQEQWCDGLNPKVSLYYCPYGCSNGACLPPSYDTTPPYLYASTSSSRVNSTSWEIQVTHLSMDQESPIAYRYINYFSPGSPVRSSFASNFSTCPTGSSYCTWLARRAGFTIPGNYTIEVTATSGGGTSIFNTSAYLS